MIIQFNAAKNVRGNDGLIASSTSLISEELSWFDNRITRLEVHLSDENGNKSGFEDKQCVLEARIVGMQPIAVTDNSSTIEQAIVGAIDKLKSSIKKTLWRTRCF